MIAQHLTSPSSFDWIVSSTEESFPVLPIVDPLDDDNDGLFGDKTAMTDYESTFSSTFSWSDFPCQGEGDTIPSLPLSSATPIDVPPVVTTTKTASKPRHLLRDYIPTAKVLPPIQSPPSPTSCCQAVSIDHDAIPNSACFQSDNKTSCAISKTTKRVSFAPLVRVRTHTIVLGDHPLCSGGMALQLGWESTPTQYVPLQRNRNWSTGNNNAPSTLSRLNYHERRQRLMELTGYTSYQLLHQEYLLVCCNASTTACEV
jgi:hypothetical protein